MGIWKACFVAVAMAVTLQLATAHGAMLDSKTERKISVEGDPAWHMDADSKEADPDDEPEWDVEDDKGDGWEHWDSEDESESDGEWE